LGKTKKLGLNQESIFISFDKESKWKSA